MTYFLKSGNTFRVSSKEAMDLHEHLPAGNYVIPLNYKSYYVTLGSNVLNINAWGGSANYGTSTTGGSGGNIYVSNSVVSSVYVQGNYGFNSGGTGGSVIIKNSRVFNFILVIDC